MGLQIDDLACSRNGRLLLSGVNLALERGNLAHVRGANGSGKTTLLMTLAGILPPARGVILWDDEPVQPDCIAYAGHLDGMKPVLTLRENLEAWSRILGPAKTERVSGALEILGIESCADTPAGHCSAGERRRAALARVLLADRPLWLLDEPGAALDSSGTAILGDLLRAHLEEGWCALISAHVLLSPEPAVVVDLGATGKSAPIDPQGWFL